MLGGASGGERGRGGADGLHAPFHAHSRRLDQLMQRSLSRMPAPRLRTCACAVSGRNVVRLRCLHAQTESVPVSYGGATASLHGRGHCQGPQSVALATYVIDQNLTPSAHRADLCTILAAVSAQVCQPVCMLVIMLT